MQIAHRIGKPVSACERQEGSIVLCLHDDHPDPLAKANTDTTEAWRTGTLRLGRIKGTRTRRIKPSRMAARDDLDDRAAARVAFAFRNVAFHFSGH